MCSKGCGFNINGFVPYVVSESFLERQIQFCQFSKVVDLIKKANKDKTDTREIVAEARYCAVSAKLQGKEGPKFVAEVARDGKINLDDDNCEQRLLRAKEQA